MEGAFKKRTSKARRQGRAASRDAATSDAVLPALAKGLGVTMRHFFTNIATGKDIVTVQYPEEKVPYPERYRGLHRLMQRDDGSVRCVACMCCPTACPAHCITIVAEETGNAEREAPGDLRDRRAALRRLRAVRRGLPVRRDPHGHRRARAPDREALRRGARQERPHEPRHAVDRHAGRQERLARPPRHDRSARLSTRSADRASRSDSTSD